MGISSSAAIKKGKVYERKIAKKLSKIFGVELVRTTNSGALDIKGDLRPKILDDGTMPDFDWVIECKNHKVTSVTQWVRQMHEEEKANNKKGMIVFHVHNSNRNIVIMREEVAEKELYPFYVEEPEVVIHYQGVKSNVSSSMGRYISFLQNGYELFKRHFMISFKSIGIRMMNIETFNLLYKNKPVTE